MKLLLILIASCLLASCASTQVIAKKCKSVVGSNDEWVCEQL